MTTEVAEQTIIWKGILTRKMTVNLRQELLNVLLHGASRLTINLDEVEAFDLSCLLLLCAAKRHAVCRGQSLVLEGAENAAVVAIVRRYGYGGERFCLAQCDGVCLWSKPENKPLLPVEHADGPERGEVLNGKEKDQDQENHDRR